MTGLIDYHVHTLLCNHASGTIEKYVQKAVDIGLSDMCFLDHLTIVESGKRLSMDVTEVSLYFHAIQTLKERYKSVINIKTGLEIDFNPAYIDIVQKIVETYSFDVIGSSIHFLGDMNIASRNSAWSHGKVDPDYVYALYFEQLEKMLNYNYFDVVCHIDMVKKFGMKPEKLSKKLFDKKVDNIISKIRKKNLIVEINTSGYNYPAKEAYPSFDIIKKCHAAGIGITLGSDSHNPENVGQHYDKALTLLRAAGYTHLTTFSKHTRKLVPIYYVE